MLVPPGTLRVCLPTVLHPPGTPGYASLLCLLGHPLSCSRKQERHFRHPLSCSRKQERLSRPAVSCSREQETRAFGSVRTPAVGHPWSTAPRGAFALVLPRAPSRSAFGLLVGVNLPDHARREVCLLCAPRVCTPCVCPASYVPFVGSPVAVHAQQCHSACQYCQSCTRGCVPLLHF